MAKVREAGGEQDRDRGAWVAMAKANIHTKRPVKKGVYLSDDAARRLETAALVEGVDQSCLLDSLIRTTLVGYFAGYRRGKDSPESEDVQAA